MAKAKDDGIVYIYGEAWNLKVEKTTNKQAKASKHKNVKKIKKKASKEGLVLRFFNMDWIVLNTLPSSFYTLHNDNRQ